MRDVILQELKECNNAIRKVSDEQSKIQGEKQLAYIIELMVSLSKLAKTEGIIVLEYEIDNYTDMPCFEFYKTILSLMLDCWDPNVIEELALAKYYADGVEAYDALTYLLILFSVLRIQEGASQYLIKTELLCFVPDNVAALCTERENSVEISESIKGNTTECEEDLTIKDVEKLYEGDMAAIPGDAFYYLFSVVDHAICTLDDISIRKLLEKINLYELPTAMYGLSGEARRRIFSNVTENTALIFATHMKYLKPDRMDRVVNEIENIFYELVENIQRAEIRCDIGESLCLFKDIYDHEKNDSRKPDLNIIDKDIQKIMKEYTSMYRKVADLPW